MAHHHHRFPVWAHRLLLNPVRRLTDPPEKLLSPHVTPGMTVLEPGCGLGWFTLPLARMVGPEGRVVAVEIEPRVLEGLKNRARKAGLLDRLDCRLADAALCLDDLAGQVDFAPLMNILHEIADLDGFLSGLARALKPGGTALVSEPKGPVDEDGFRAELDKAVRAGLTVASREPDRFLALLAKPD